MALINCPECGKEISDEAKTCPNCGKPLRKSKEKKKINKKAVIIIFTIIGLVVIGGVVGFICYRNSPGYTIKQYVKAYETKDDELLSNLILLPERHQLVPFEKKNKYKAIIDVKYDSTSSKEEAYEYMKNWMGKNELENSRIGKLTSYHINYYYDKDKTSGQYCYVVRINNKNKILYYNSLECFD